MNPKLNYEELRHLKEKIYRKEGYNYLVSVALTKV